jgi:hypothetical protein
MCLSSSSRPRAWLYVHAGVAPCVSLGLVLSAYARLEKGPLICGCPCSLIVIDLP